jgi:hypothetical protein
VDLTNMPGNAGATTTRPYDKMGVVWFTANVPTSQTKDFSSVPADLKTFILNANNGNGSYRSQGGTNGAGGLYRASLMYGNPSAVATYTDATGKTRNYKRVVLFITDGVSNQFLDQNASDLLGGQSSDTTYPVGSYCRGLASLVVESAQCQTSDVGGKYVKNKTTTWDRPVTQMTTTSANNLRNATVNASVFVIALSSIPATGLKDGVASSTSYFFSAESLTTDTKTGKTNVDGIIDTINNKVTLGDCVPGPSGAVTGSVQTDQFVNGTGGLSYPQVGTVAITGATTLTAPIIAGKGGVLSYNFPSVPQGSYRLEAHLYYHHPLDPVGVMREYSKIWSAGQALSDFTVDVSPSTQGTSFSQKIDQPLTLKLNGDVCAAP